MIEGPINVTFQRTLLRNARKQREKDMLRLDELVDLLDDNNHVLPPAQASELLRLCELRGYDVPEFKVSA